MTRVQGKSVNNFSALDVKTFLAEMNNSANKHRYWTVVKNFLGFLIKYYEEVWKRYQSTAQSSRPAETTSRRSTGASRLGPLEATHCPRYLLTWTGSWRG